MFDSFSQNLFRELPDNLRTCLFHSGSLTKKLNSFADDQISITIESQSWKKPLAEEAKALSLPSGRYGLIRESYLTCEDRPWVYARAVIPPQTLQAARRLAKWGSQPLGEYLFSDKYIYRGDIAVTQFKLSDVPYEPVYNLDIDEQSLLWARRSIFFIKQRPLLLIEIFLPEALQCINTSKK